MLQIKLASCEWFSAVNAIPQFPVSFDGGPPLRRQITLVVPLGAVLASGGHLRVTA